MKHDISHKTNKNKKNSNYYDCRFAAGRLFAGGTTFTSLAAGAPGAQDFASNV